MELELSIQNAGKVACINRVKNGQVYTRSHSDWHAHLECMHYGFENEKEFGRGEWIRTTDLLVPKLAAFSIALIINKIFSCKISIWVLKVHSWVGSWVGRLMCS